MRSAWVGLLVTACVATACASSEPGSSTAAPTATEASSSPPPSTESPVTEPPASEPPATETVPTEPPTTETPVTEPPAIERAPVERTSLTGALSEIPLSIRDLALTDGGVTTITYVDLSAASEDLGRVPLVNVNDPEAAAESFAEFAGPNSVSRGGTGYVPFVPTEFPGSEGWHNSAEFSAELGFSPFDLTAIVQLSASPLLFAAATGDVVISDELPERAPGVQTAGNGADGEVSFDDQSIARRLGRPLHLAQREDWIAVSRTREFVVDWRDPATGSVLDAPAYADLAAALDANGVTTASLHEGAFVVEGPSLFPDQLRSDFYYPIRERFELVAIGGAFVDGQTMSTVVYAFADAAAAERARVDVETLWRWGESAVAVDLAYSDDFDVVAVTQVGPTVVVSAEVEDTSSLLRLENLFNMRDGLFVHQ